MPYYEYECEHGHAIEHFYDMGEATSMIHMNDGQHYCDFKRVFGFNHTEDRRHMRNGISGATGERYAQSRSEERRVEKTKGIEFISRSDMPKQWRKLGDYARHVNQGGERLDPHLVNPPEQTSSKGELLRKMSERGIRFGS